MIPKGNQRGGGLQLAAHLQNTFDNDNVEIADLRGAVSADLADAFSEWHAESKGTNCKKYLYSLSLNPDQRQGPLTRDQYFDFIARVETTLKLTNQPRAIVFHVKHGRQHCHVVWSRIDCTTMRAVPMSHDHQKLRRVAQEFAKEHGLVLPEGMKKDWGKERYEDQKKTADLHEKQQEERTGFTKTERMKVVADAWMSTRTSEDFIRALAEKDLYLARGDKRAHVIVDLGGEIHSLSRQMKGVKTGHIKERLATLPPEKLCTVDQAQAKARQARDVRQKARDAEAIQTPGPTPEQRRAALQNQHEEQRKTLASQSETMRLRHAREMGKLTIDHAAINAGIQKQRQDSEEKRQKSIVGRILPMRLLLKPVHKLKDVSRERRQQTEIEALEARHGSEHQDDDRKMAGLLRVQKRETKSLETTFKREEFQRIAAMERHRETGSQGRETDKDKLPPPAQSERILKIMATFNAVARPAPPTQQTPSTLTPHYNRAAAGGEAAKPMTAKQSASTEAAKATVREDFNKAAKPGQTEKLSATDPKVQRLAELFRRAAEETETREPELVDRDRSKHFRKNPTDFSIRR